MALKKLTEWAEDNNFSLDTYGHSQDSGMEVLYDEEVVTQQVNSWLHKLTGLCSSVPNSDRPGLVEQIIKSIKKQLL